MSVAATVKGAYFDNGSCILLRTSTRRPGCGDFEDLANIDAIAVADDVSIAWQCSVVTAAPLINAKNDTLEAARAKTTQLLLEIMGSPKPYNLEKPTPFGVVSMDDLEVRKYHRAARINGTRLSNQVPIVSHASKVLGESLLKPAIVSRELTTSSKRVARLDDQFGERLGPIQGTMCDELETIAPDHTWHERRERPTIHFGVPKQCKGARNLHN